MKVAALGLLLAVAVAPAGCSHKVVTATGTTVTTDQAEKSVTVQTKNGTATIGGAIDPSKLGAPIYPGALTNADSRGILSTQTDKGSTVMASFKTTDGFDQVYQYYKGQFPAGSVKQKQAMGGTSSALFQVGDENSADAVMVEITSDKPDETTILVTHVTKNAGTAPSQAP